MNNLSICTIKEFPEDFGILEIDAKRVSTLREFYEVLAETMDFPDYFGFNLDSLDELLNDLSWIEDEKIGIYFSNSESFLQKERNETKILTLLDLLDATCEDWKWIDNENSENEKKSLLFGFDKSERIENLLNKLL
ncbi:barnase inhibitor [Lacihabitans sp. LS3-19]|uniref:barstar family protein n=1 Tax=Lacihabitans sp. LS3-19 TaxID=2487335 RepID=UPI0020CF71D0|nr:barstar family protein [Lacihabitans sp. LS3-19]MCP9769682.1 barnase inhibitor [Lacihabitans sp. LS3-19]